MSKIIQNHLLHLNLNQLYIEPKMRFDQSKYMILLSDRHLRHSGSLGMGYMMTTLHIIQLVFTLSFIRRTVRSGAYGHVAAGKRSIWAVTARGWSLNRLHGRDVYRYFHSGIPDDRIKAPFEYETDYKRRDFRTIGVLMGWLLPLKIPLKYHATESLPFYKNWLAINN